MRTSFILLSLVNLGASLRFLDPEADEISMVRLQKEEGPIQMDRMQTGIESTIDMDRMQTDEVFTNEIVSSLFGDQEDLHEGEAETLVAQLNNIGTTPKDWRDIKKELVANGETFVGKNYNMTGHMKTLHMLATKEEIKMGTDFGATMPGRPWMMTGLSDFGNAVPKYPRSWVEAILKMDSEKKFRYMFSGTTFLKKNKNRKWLLPWIKEHFNNSDYFRATDKPGAYMPMGEWDKSLVEQGGFRPKDCYTQKKADFENPDNLQVSFGAKPKKKIIKKIIDPEMVREKILSGDSASGYEKEDPAGYCMKWDRTYWQEMAHSQFILTPGGDAPYSFRYHEAFLAGAIPVINSIEGDYLPRQSTMWINMIGYEHKMTKDFPHVFDETVALRNQKKFIRYQTFLEGDNDPRQDKQDGTYDKLFGAKMVMANDDAAEEATDAAADA